MPAARRIPLGGRRDHPWIQGTVAFALYVALAVVLIGRRALTDPAGGTLGSGPDVQVFVWGLRWWPYALGHGLDPFVTHKLWPPTGVSTLWTSTVPGLALLLAPITIAFGPLVSWNLLCVLAPATAAWGTYLLCRELNVAPRWAFVGGTLFGFSAFEQAQGLAHLQLTACVAVPLIARTIVRRAQGRITGPRFAMQLAGLIALQALISVEVLTTMTIVGLLSAAAEAILTPTARRELLSTLAWTGAALAASLPVTALVAVEMLRTAPGAINPASAYSVDLANLVIPTRIALVGGGWAQPLTRHFTANLAEQDGYLGIAALTIAIGYLAAHRHQLRARLLTSTLTITIVLSLGPRLHVDGRIVAPLPGTLLSFLPTVRDALPSRLALYTSLCTAAVTALWLNEPRQVATHRNSERRPMSLRIGALVISLAPLLPAPGTIAVFSHAPPEALTGHAASASTIISLPFWDVHDRALELQAQANMRFALFDKWIQDVPPRLQRFARTPALYGTLHADTASLPSLLCRNRITTVLLWPGYASGRLATALGARRPTTGPTIHDLDCPTRRK